MHFYALVKCITVKDAVCTISLLIQVNNFMLLNSSVMVQYDLMQLTEFEVFLPDTGLLQIALPLLIKSNAYRPRI